MSNIILLRRVARYAAFLPSHAITTLWHLFLLTNLKVKYKIYSYKHI